MLHHQRGVNQHGVHAVLVGQLHTVPGRDQPAVALGYRSHFHTLLHLIERAVLLRVVLTATIVLHLYDHHAACQKVWPHGAACGLAVAHAELPAADENITLSNKSQHLYDI